MDVNFFISCFTVFMLATRGHRIIHNIVNFGTLQLVAGVAGKRRAKFHLATLITRMVFTSFLSQCYGSVSRSLAQIHAVSDPTACTKSNYYFCSVTYGFYL